MKHLADHALSAQEWDDYFDLVNKDLILWEHDDLPIKASADHDHFQHIALHMYHYNKLKEAGEDTVDIEEHITSHLKLMYPWLSQASRGS